MKHSIKKFLQFNGKDILFLAVDGQYWVALKPICEALKLNWVHQFKGVKEHKILGQLLSVQTMVGADNRVRKMVALPEKYVYGWLFGISSGSQALLEYQFKCYEVLYDYFHGSIGKRLEVLVRKAENMKELELLENDLRHTSASYVRIQQLRGEIMRSGSDLKRLDEEAVNKQLTLTFN